MIELKEQQNRWQYQLALVSVCLFVYRAASRSVLPFLPLFIREIGGTEPAQTAVWSGWIFAVPFIVSFFATPFWGSFGDRFGRKWITVAAAFGAAVSLALSGTASTLLQLLLYSALLEAFGGFYPATVSLVAAHAPREKTGSALGILQFAAAAGNIVGPIIGGLLAISIPYKHLFVLISIPVAACGVLLLIGVREQRMVSGARRFHSFADNWRHVLRSNPLLVCCAAMCLYAAGTALIRPTFALFVESSLHGIRTASMNAGIMLGVFGGASALSSALLGTLQKTFNSRRLLTVSAAASGCFLIISSFMTSFLMLAAALAVTGFALGILLPLLHTMMRLGTDDERIAGVLGVGSSFQTFGNITAPVLSGYLVASFGLQLPFILSGALLLTIAALRAGKGVPGLETNR